MGQNLTIIKRNGSCVPLENRRTATRVTQAKQTWALNADDKLDITVESTSPQSYAIGDTVNVFGRAYKLNRLPKESKMGAHAFSYDLEFEGVQYDLLRAHYDLTIDTTSNALQDVKGDSLTGDLRTFLNVLVANANRVFPGKWSVGSCPETEKDKTLTFGEADNCLMALQTLCNESNFNKEFEIVETNGVNVIHVMDSVGQIMPYTFRFGRGGGMYRLNRGNVSDSNIVTRLKVYGSASNITSRYRADRLCLPGKSKAQSYIEKAGAVAKYGVFEGRKDFDDIRPTFTGTVQAVFAGDVLKFYDASFPFDLNAKNADGSTKYLMDGVEAKIHFNTGNLAGYDFTIKSYDHSTHTFIINKFTDDRGDVFPSATSPAFQFETGDEYKITDITYSDALISQAENRLQEEANAYYDQNCQPKVSYSLEVTKQWLKNLVDADDANVVNVFAPGDYLHIVDDDIAVDKSIRVKSLVRNVLDPYDYSLTISDMAVTTSVTARVLSELVDIDKIIKANNLADPARARANWRSSREVLDMVFDPDGDYYTEKIKPSSVDTIALSVGAKSMQFCLRDTVFQPNFNGNKNVLKWRGGVLTHYTIDDAAERSWNLSDSQNTVWNDAESYYIYARCQRSGNSGTIVTSSTQHKVDGNSSYYYFLIGVLNSVDTELQARSISLTYGFTMVNGRFIKTGRIESADGTTYFDLDNSEIGGRIVFNSNGHEKTIEELDAESVESKDYINNTLPSILDGIQAQLDGQIEQFFHSYNPTASSAPTNGWTTTALKEEHLGDLFYNTSNGKVFRWVKIGNTYTWQELQDTEVAQALALANDALQLSRTKRRIFTTTPTPPYDVGDLWAQGDTGDIMRCNVARLSGNYSEADWGKASKYTDNSALETFVSGTFAQQVGQITEQLDGKIETWFQTSDPSVQWTGAAEKNLHVGDMWYNSASKTLKCYKSDHTWGLVEDAKAVDAYDAASLAQDTADGKRRVFVVTPTPPYDVGDLWAQGSGGEILRCKNAKQDGQNFDTSDWDPASKYDNTKTTIDGGIVTSGTIQVAGNTQSILAGMTGQGTSASAVRFWAGSSFGNRASAPFRVRQDGNVVMTDAHVEGHVEANSGTIGGFDIGQQNISGGLGCSFTVGEQTFNSCLGVRSENKTLAVQANSSEPRIYTYNFAYKENNRYTSRNVTTKINDWQNISVANIMDIDYFSSTEGVLVDGYGFQYAMLGSGHVVMDAIVESVGLTTITDFTANNMVRMINVPFHCNRIAVSSNYNDCVLVMPCKQAILDLKGVGIMGARDNKFSFRLSIINVGDKAICIAGRNNTVVSGSARYNTTELPTLYQSDGGAYTGLTSFSIARKTNVDIMLIYANGEYGAYIMNRF